MTPQKSPSRALTVPGDQNIIAGDTVLFLLSLSGTHVTHVNFSVLRILKSRIYKCWTFGVDEILDILPISINNQK